jgi:ketosteroid isomerase-like protein
MMNRDELQAWLDAYVDAWRTYDPSSIAALFTEDATYAYHPWDEGDYVLRGSDAIVANWLEEQDAPGSWEARYRPLLVAGDRAIATGTTRYADGEIFWNLWVLGFRQDGRCAEFVEWYMVRQPEGAT